MAYPPGDLAILSAEVYDDSPAFASSARQPVTRKLALASGPSQRGSAEGGPRKRARTQTAEDAAEPAEAEDDKKRSRGRPRLDTKDETAADTLERKVQHLKDTNEEMSNAFMQLHDFAVSNGLLDKIPEFGCQLRQATEKFLSLARDANEEDAKDGEPKPDADGAAVPEGRSGQVRPRSPPPPGPRNAPTAAAAASLAPQTETKPVILYGGLTAYHDPAENFPAAPLTVARQRQQQQPHPAQQQLHQPWQLPNAPMGYHVISEPNLGNASFPLQPTPSFPSVGVSIPSHSPWASLPIPSSYTGHEFTFGRRLHRYALEQAYLLSSMPNPPEKLFSRVFGFCTLIESRWTIHRRLARILGHDAQRSLQNWTYPFYNLGGAGTQIDFGAAVAASLSEAGVEAAPAPLDEPNPNPDAPPAEPCPMESRTTKPNTAPPILTPSTSTSASTSGAPTPRLGSQGTIDILKPSVTAGFAPGPFTADITSVRDRALDDDMRMTLPGFDGEYFDCDEVELYLYQRGVVIPYGRDTIAAEIDPEHFPGGEGGIGSWREDDALVLPQPEGRMELAPPAPGLGTPGRARDVADTAEWGMDIGAAVAAAVAPGLGDPGLAGALPPADPFLSAPGGLGEAVAPPPPAQVVDPFLSATAVPPGAGLAAPNSSLFLYGGYGMVASAGRAGRRQMVVFDVERLVRELTDRAICLGRTPGIKKDDIDGAFWAAVRAGVA
ncbi:hypothetical protein C8A05DRAFT_44556 [Staphylotrichum tortipilum]|uniref:Uncharacterized protein n=1 Tax=Staphylotrichum tortipilum TaxID=2831512 RepID=A0AAN6RTU4_9PEZI|nr:hypothetical protein C8A05DRAFT_44556 [Staphylotrichum longicolle]